MQPVSGVLSTQKARMPGCDSQHLYTGEALLTLLETARADASCASSSELSPWSTKLATICRLFCCSAERGAKMWLAQILARCPALLQFRHIISADTLQSLTACTVLPQRLHFPWKNASASSRLLGAPLGRGFLACVFRWFFCPFLGGLRYMAYALSLFCSSQRLDLSQPCASLRMNCHVTPTPWRRSS